MRRLLAATLAVVIGTHTFPLIIPGWSFTATAQEQKNEQGSITELSERAERDVGRLVRAARKSEDPLLATDSETGKPFWAALKSLNASVLLMSNGAALKDDSFHIGLNNTIRATAASFATYHLSDANDETVSDALDTVEAVVAALEETFSKPAARARKGGELTEVERKKLDAIRAKQEILEKRLAAIEPKVKDNPKAKAAIEEIRRRSSYVRNRRYTVADFAGGLLAVGVIDGLLYGSHWWWGPWGTWYPEFAILYESAYEDALVDVAYDWATDGALEFDTSVLPLEDIGSEINLEEVAADLDEVNTDLTDGLGDTELVGLSDFSEGDLSIEDIDLGADELDGADADLGGSLNISEEAITEGLNEAAEDMQLDSIGGADLGALDALESPDLSDLSDSDALGSDIGGGAVMDLGGSDLDAGGMNSGFDDGGFGGFGDMGMDDLGGLDDF